MNHSADDPDDLVRKKIDLNHITKMSYQMHVPDSITVGPNRSTISRLHQENEQLPVRMEVPNSIRLGNNTNTGLSNGSDYSTDNNLDHSFDSSTQQPSFNPSNIEPPSDDDYTTIDTPNNPHQHQPIKLAESWHIEPITNFDDKHVINKLQLLQNRIQHIERTLARRDFRDRFMYTCIIGYFLLQALLSVRRSMLN
ncbi:unnamed protein product [Adineta steineri]|uniref:Uncharacterized protein n=1 Tax=Adineta steineri TaxID=433720 RepID=A0A818SY09_9BILA|nr:unnamed protein product [Adineta steineri]CAF3678940.1 unnamed protein product [Adineta steineri]